jgi:DNA polymerase-3 subunit delta
MGEEPFYIDLISDYIQENVLSKEEKEFNQTILYGKDCDVSAIVNAAKRYPLMATHQVIIVKEAQSLDKIDALESYVQNPLSSTILVLCYKYKTLDKRKTFAKTLIKKGVLYESARLYDNQVPAWIQNYVKEKGFQIIPEAAQILAESLGTDLSKIANELSKVFILIPPRSTINPQIIEENIGISKDFNVFELVNALGNRDVYKANAIIHYFTSNPKAYPLIVVINSLFLFYRNLLIYHTLKDKSRNNAAAILKIHVFLIRNYEQAARNFKPAQVRRALAYLREYDLKSKGVDNQSTTHDQILKELIFFLLH